MDFTSSVNEFPEAVHPATAPQLRRSLCEDVSCMTSCVTSRELDKRCTPRVKLFPLTASLSTLAIFGACFGMFAVPENAVCTSPVCNIPLKDKFPETVPA